MEKKSYPRRRQMVIDHMRFLSARYQTGIENICIRRGDVMRSQGITRTQATRIVKAMVDDGTLIEDYLPNVGRLGMYEYWLSMDVVERVNSQLEMEFAEGQQ